MNIEKGISHVIIQLYLQLVVDKRATIVLATVLSFSTITINFRQRI